jgi:16S rRNA (guanine527-N7)-methyltransferase
VNGGEILAAGLAALREGDGDVEELLGGRLEDVLFLLNNYIEEIERFNPAYGLVGAQDRRDLTVRHILDSLAPLGIIRRLLKEHPGPEGAGGRPEGNRPGTTVPAGGSPAIGGPGKRSGHIADAGSGAGLPGIPLAIGLPDCRFTLIERMGRRAGFLRNTLAVLGLNNAETEEGETERTAPGRFDLTVFRAFRPLEPAILKGLFRLLAPGGVLAAYKGRRDKIEAEMGAIAELTGGWEAVPCPAPFLDEDRHLVIIRPPA